MSLKDYYPVRREQSDILDTAVIGGGVEGLLCALSLSELEAVSVKVFQPEVDAQAGPQKLVLPVNAQNAIYAINPLLFKSIMEAGAPASPGSSSSPAELGSRSFSGAQRLSSTGGDSLFTPAVRGIHVPLEIDHEKLLALCANALPRGTVEFGHRLIALQEDSDGVRLTFQDRPAVRAKLVVGTGTTTAALGEALKGSSQWGRGRFAQLCTDVAPPLGSEHPLQALGLAIEGVVEFIYSLSEHGLTPAAIRRYESVMTDRASSCGSPPDMAQLPVGFWQKPFPPVEQPNALKSAASPPMGTSPPTPGLKMQDLRPLEPPRGLWSHGASVRPIHEIAKLQ